jgi:drug/metabolite transporter (DMT)-like permease
MNASSSSKAGHINPLGLACAAGGASLWGLSFVVPLFMPGISAWDVSLGRYLVFGTLGAFFVLRAKLGGFTLTRSQWIKAFVFAATGYYGCYTALVFAIELTGPALPTLVMGLTPVSVAVVANLRTREVPFAHMLPALGVLGGGLLLVNLARHGQGLAADNLWWGMFASLLAQGLLTYYLVANILFLKANPRITPLAWANVTGAVLLVFSASALILRFIILGGQLPWHGTQTTLFGYAMGSVVLGLGVSWLGGTLWNKANAMLPASVAGQCIVFWPISGIIYACIVKSEFPGVWELLGMLMVFTGVVWGLKAARSSRR